MLVVESSSNGSSDAPTLTTPDGQGVKLDKKKSIILGIIGLAFIVLIFWKVIPQIGSYSEAWDALQSMGLVAMGIIIVSVLVYLAAYGFPFKAATPGLGYWPSQQVNQAAFAISNGVPGGGAIGLAVQFGMLTSYGIAGTAATAAITAVALWSTFVTLALPIMGVVALTISGDDAGKYVWIGVIGLAVLVAAVVIFVLIMRSEPLARKLGSWATSVARWFGKWIKALKEADFVAPVVKFRSDMYDLLKRRWSAITGAQLLVSFTQFFILYAALWGVEQADGHHTSILLVFAAFAISQLGLMIPITPGGLGTVDAAMIGLMTAFGVSTGDATAAALVWRASSYVPQIIIGVIALVLWYKKAGQMLAKAKS